MSKLNLLRHDFLKQFNQVAKYNGNWRFLDSRPLMMPTYEYFRNRHIKSVTTFTPEEYSSLQHNLLAVYYHLGLRNALDNMVIHMGPEDVFDYAISRSATQFLIDDAGKLIPDDIIKHDCIVAMVDSFDEKEHLLELSGSDHEFGDYPREPVPDHTGVPDSHDWWKRLEKSYRVFDYL